MERWSEDSPSYRPKDLEDLIPGYNMSNSFNDTKQSLVVNK